MTSAGRPLATVWLRRLVTAALVLLATVFCEPDAQAHAFNPALLELAEVEPSTFIVVWKRPTRGQQAPILSVVLPAHCETQGEPSRSLKTESVVERWQVDCGANGLVGYTIGVEGPALARLEVVTLVTLADGGAQRRVLRTGDATLVVGIEKRSILTTSGYLRLGVEHILTGLDHLLFVLGLTLLVRSRRRLAATVTAFTVGHSVTLSLVALDVLILPSKPVESVIALSILLLAVELANRRQRERSSPADSGHASLTERHPWAVAAGFGLVHGAGFAGALAEVGLPATEIPMTLFVFNAGIEIGQLLFVAFVVVVFTLLRRVAPQRHVSVQALLYLPIGGLAVFWIIERTIGLWNPS